MPRTVTGEYMAGFDLLVDPAYRQGGLNTVLLEATCSKTDLVAANLEAVDSLWHVYKKKGLYDEEFIGNFQMRDVEDLTRVLWDRYTEWLADGGKKAKERERAARNYNMFCHEFSLEKNGDRYEKLFRHAVAKKKLELEKKAFDGHTLLDALDP
ncbi:hypothetical protein HDV05_004571 [Chytridiales sp. JEL 0842]|nr:hypothetical protein HDV05_004571 [Chytridiales sp. JEL 0842]